MTLAANARAIARTTSEQLYIDDTGALRSTRFDDFYFNPGCGAEETQHVFLQGNRLAQRWADAADASASQPAPTTFCIAETGFGTGLNFLAALDLWQATHEQQLVKVAPQLVYYATEKYPLSYAALAKALQYYNPYPGLAAQLLEQYPDAIAGDYLLPFNLPQCRASLVLLFGDSVDALGRLEHYPPAATAPHANSDGPGSSATQQARGAQKIDAWLLDGFAPAQNPSMWSAELFAAIGRHSGAGSTAATFSVARAVRDGLASAGFTARKQPGFGRKRDMLSAQWARAPQTPGPARKHFTLANCYRRAAPTGKPGAASQSAIVIGAGIAGCCTAHHLAARGWQVTVID
ncbi:MAG: tRNA (5-methylaminomethyl-2-thiouridine)(34)-methyltransferase MnmD, partial [Gammaproteobacteria bacterium]|nr:tRNA (5-methylaminomethyl-2-thiouridine)(34)-methyltransferase MnmD [Gammaproteobacteria bacterium]